MLITRKTSVRSMHNRGGNLNNKSKDEPTIYLYGDIGGWFGIDHLEFVKDFNKIDAETIHLRIDSQGGDVFAARAIKTAIMQHKAKVIGHIDGIAASAASFLAMGCDEIEIVDGGFLMIHNATSIMDILGYFNIDDLKQLLTDIGKEVNLHEKINESIANDYAKKTGIGQEKFLAWMADETWFTAQEALNNKLVDRVYEGEPVEGSYDLSVFAKAPEALKLRNCKESKRTMEKALRDAGLSNKQAKAILAEAFKEDHWDVDPFACDPPPVVQRDADPPEPEPPPEPQRDVARQRLNDPAYNLLLKGEKLLKSQGGKGI